MDVSMVITTNNRAKLLRNSLARLTELTMPEQLIVVDDGGSDETNAVCAEFASDFHELIHIYTHNPGVTICSHARNIGLRRAEFELVVTTEPELVYKTDVLAQFAEAHEAHPTEVISAGKIYFLPNTGYNGLEVPDGSGIADGWVAPHTALYHREWLMAIGGWDESFPGNWGFEDTDLLTRLRLSGHGQYIDKSIEALHQFHGLGGDANSVNDNHFRNKPYVLDPENFNPDDLIANRGVPWGTIKTS